jgi:hypothetical protein
MARTYAVRLAEQGITAFTFDEMCRSTCSVVTLPRSRYRKAKVKVAL